MLIRFILAALRRNKHSNTTSNHNTSNGFDIITRYILEKDTPEHEYARESFIAYKDLGDYTIFHAPDLASIEHYNLLLSHNMNDIRKFYAKRYKRKLNL